MTTHKPNLGEGKTGVFNEAPVFRNGVAEMPDTPTARANFAELVRAAQDVGYTRIGEAVGHDKSFVCRLLQGEARANVFEWMAFLDATVLRLASPDADSAADAELLSALLKKVSTVFAQAREDVESGKARFSFADDGAVLMLAERGIKSMRQEAGQ